MFTPVYESVGVGVYHGAEAGNLARDEADRGEERSANGGKDPTLPVVHRPLTLVIPLLHDVVRAHPIIRVRAPRKVLVEPVTS